MANIRPRTRNVRVGPFCVIGANVVLGDDCVLHSHVVLEGHSKFGRANEFFAFSAVGGKTQDLKYTGDSTYLEVGDHNVFRENTTVHRSTHADSVTRIGSHNLFLCYSHVAHDCQIGSHVILSNSVALAGHIEVGDYAIISGAAAIHQFCRVGRLAFLSGVSATTMDLPPFWIMQDFNRVRGLNLVGMKRAGMPPAERMAVRKAYRIIYLTRPAVPMSAAVLRIEAELGEFPAIQELVEFIRSSKRGICGAHRLASGGDDEKSAAA